MSMEEEVLFKVIKQIEFCYGHRLINYNGKCAHLHGHNGLVEIVLATKQLDARGMVVDFVDVKKIVNDFLNRELDHKMILNASDPFVKILQDNQEPMFLMQENPTAENIAKVIYQYAKGQGLPILEVRLWETGSSYAVYGENT